MLKRLHKSSRVPSVPLEKSGYTDQAVQFDKAGATATRYRGAAAAGIDNNPSRNRSTGRKAQPPFITQTFGAMNSSIEKKSRTPTFGLARHHRIKPGALKMPAAARRHIHEVVVERRSSSPRGARAKYLAMTLLLKCFPN
jgi:hypothetical protein